MKKLLFLFLVVGLFSPAARVYGDEPQSKWKDIKFITTEELKQIYDAKKDFLLINALSPIEYTEERIKGSVNIPYMHLKSGKTRLPEERNKMLVFYCKGPK